MNQLILIPGTMNDADVWRDQLAPLSRVGSVTVADITQHGTMAELADAVLGGADERFALVGFSLGGIVALEIMRRAGQRVTHLGLIGTTAYPDPPEREASRRAVLAALASEDRFHGFGATLARQYLAPQHANDPALVSRIKAMAERLGPDVLERQTKLARSDNSDVLGRITCPVAVACGADDQVTPPAIHRRMAAGVAGATLDIVPDSGHVVPMEQPAAVAQIIARLVHRLPE